MATAVQIHPDELRPSTEDMPPPTQEGIEAIAARKQYAELKIVEDWCLDNRAPRSPELLLRIKRTEAGDVIKCVKCGGIIPPARLYRSPQATECSTVECKKRAKELAEAEEEKQLAQQ